MAVLRAAGVTDQNNGCVSRKNAGSKTPKGGISIGNKKKFAFWLTPEADQAVEENYKRSNCGSRSEFVEKAILFYCGYLNAQGAESYLPPLLSETLEKFGNRICKLMFKQAVECNITNHLIAADSDLDVDTYERLRNRRVREVMETKGKISFKDDLIFQKSL